MRKLIAGLVLLVIILTGFAALAKPEVTPLNHQIKKLYADPSDKSRLVYDIPVSVNVLDVSADHEWYKVKLNFVFGPFAYEYIGWTYIPIDKLIAQKEALASK